MARVENYLNSTGDTYPWVERDFERHEWEYKTGLGIQPVTLAGSAQLEKSEVGTQTLPPVPAVKLVSIPPGSGDLQQLLDEYRARAINIARWQAQLAVTNDPAQRKYIQGRIAAEQDILADIAAQAIVAGATPEQLQQIKNEAEEAADNAPVDLQNSDGDGGDSGVIDIIWGFQAGWVQGELNILNGLTDIGIGTVNSALNSGPSGQVLAIAGIDLSLPMPDWSYGLITKEDPILHEWSKWFGGNGVVGLATLFAFLPQGFKSGDLVPVDIRRLTYSSQKETAFANELIKMGKFDMVGYLKNPAIVELKKNGVMVVQWGFHRIAAAEKAALLSGDWMLPVRLFLR